MCSQQVLLPRLERLTGISIDTTTTSYSMLYSSTIKQLHVRIRERTTNPSNIRIALEAAQHTLTSIVDLWIDDFPDVARPPPITYWTLPQLRTLRVVNSSSLSAEVIRALAAFPHLRILELWLEGVPAIKEAERPIGFSSLRELELHGSATNIDRFLSILCPPHLESIELFLRPSGPRSVAPAGIAAPTRLVPSSRHYTGCNSSVLSHFPSASQPPYGLTRTSAHSETCGLSSPSSRSQAQTREVTRAFPTYTATRRIGLSTDGTLGRGTPTSSDTRITRLAMKASLTTSGFLPQCRP
ncbi:hypothetical protein BV20DRAFT_630498 [Pilatotrama ljubarskyi]|nr:hypothetical protein BV20DRAFT_630498 [Pilatotrama ljubarskyi]